VRIRLISGGENPQLKIRDDLTGVSMANQFTGIQRAG
jgi:hypothetical protein